MFTRFTGIGRYWAIGALAGAMLAAPWSCSRDKGWPLATVAHVDVSRYAGTWYEIASYPHFFQRGCTDTQADYTLDGNGRVSVKNMCHIAGRDVTVEGYADVPDTRYPGRLAVHLKVPLVGETHGEYYIVALDADYQWAVVGHPNRQYLWILSRTPALDPEIIASLLPALESTSGYKQVCQRLHCTPQRDGDAQGCKAALEQHLGAR